MHTPDTAARSILSHIKALPPETVPVAEAVGRVLADPVTSTVSIPHWDNSAMDGYAVRNADLEAGLREFHVGEAIPAGGTPTEAVRTGQCARIFTGAPVPDGADCVIRQEDVTITGESTIRVDDLRDAGAGRHVRKRGEDIETGDLVFPAGTPVGPAQLGVLVSLAHDPVSVYRRPRMAVLASGDEIADLDEREAILAGRKVATSNTYTLTALGIAAGASVVNMGIAHDDPADIRRRIEQAADADLIITSAGISVGEHDYLHQVLDQLDTTDRFWRVRMRPGAPVGFGRIGALGGVPWIGLPGNPVSTMVTFELFVRPAVRRMLGHAAPFRHTTPVRAGEAVTLGPPLRHFLRVTLHENQEDALPSARLTGPQGSGILTSMARADALMIVPEDQQVVEQGDVLQAIRLDEPRHVEDVPF